MAIGDEVGKQSVDELVAQLPAIETFIDAQLSKIQISINQMVVQAIGQLQQTVADSLKDITAEREELVNDVNDLITRIGGSRLVVPDRIK
jgi:hypothetical protein